MKNSFGVIFDMDGVLVHSNPAHKVAIREFCSQHSLEVTDTFLEERIYGRTNKEWIPELFKELTDEEVLELGDEKEALFRRNFDPESEVIPGLPEFLVRLKRNRIPMAVATSAPGENADYILDRLQIRGFFQSVLDSSDVVKGKPEPEVYQKAAAAIGFPPNRCFVFEDSIAGVEAGLRAGAQVIGVTSTHSADELKGAVRVIRTFDEVNPEDLEALL